MKMLLLSCIALFFSLPLVELSDPTADDVTQFLAWLDLNSNTECGQNLNSETLISQCQAVDTNANSGPKPTVDGSWADMCDAAGKTVTCANLKSFLHEDGTELYTKFKDCCNGCAGNDEYTGTQYTNCCAACPGPIDYFLFWAENNASTACDAQPNTFSTDCKKPDTLGGDATKYTAMCNTLITNVGCDNLDASHIGESPYTDFEKCCQNCEKKTTADDQMQCVHDDNCGAPPTTHITGSTGEKPTTVGPAPPTPPAPTTTTSVIPKTTTETEGEESDGNGTGPTDTSAPLLPPIAIWAKVIALTALIAKLL